MEVLVSRLSKKIRSTDLSKWAVEKIWDKHSIGTVSTLVRARTSGESLRHSTMGYMNASYETRVRSMTKLCWGQMENMGGFVNRGGICHLMSASKKMMNSGREVSLFALRKLGAVKR